MPSPNKTKGNNFERKVCEMMTSAYGGTWRRSPTSGAFFGGKNAVRLEGVSVSQALIDVGDIIPPDAFTGLCIECKSRKDFSFNLLFSKSAEVDSWLEQALIDYVKFEHARVLLVIFKVNRKGMYVATLKSQIDHPNGLDYYHEDSYQWFRVSTFNEEWLNDHKEYISKQCERS